MSDKKKVLVIYGDYYHSHEIIEKGFAELDIKDYDFTFIINAKDILTVEMIEQFDLIINCKGNNATSANNNPWFQKVAEVSPLDIENYVRNGKAFLAIHAGNSFRHDVVPEYTKFLGVSFVKHPPRNDLEIIMAREHEITKGIENFTIRDEHYEYDIIDDNMDILFETKSDEGGVQIGGFTKNLGKGKVCSLTPGHILSVWLNPSYQQIIKNAIKWCLK